MRSRRRRSKEEKLAQEIERREAKDLPAKEEKQCR